MADYPQFEIPMPMRELAGNNVEQARAAYGQYMDMARAAQDMIGSMVPSNPMTAGIKDAQNRSMRFAQQSVDAMFALASELTRAKDFKQVLEIQGRHAQTQMQAYSSQAQELGRRMADMAQKA